MDWKVIQWNVTSFGSCQQSLEVQIRVLLLKWDKFFGQPYVQFGGNIGPSACDLLDQYNHSAEIDLLVQYSQSMKSNQMGQFGQSRENCKVEQSGQ